MATRVRSFLSAADAAQQVMKLLENGDIPLDDLYGIIRKYGHGGSIEDYWERLCPDNGNRLASLFRPCYETTGALKPEYQYASVELAKALFWVSGLQRPKCSQQVIELEKGHTRVSFEFFFHEGLRRYSQEQHVSFVEQVSCIQEGSPDPILIRLDPWAATQLAPLNNLVSADDLNQPSRPNRIKMILDLVMRWIVSYQLAGYDNEVAALSHLIDLIARHGNVPVEFSISPDGKVYPIVQIGEREKSTLRSRGSASERPPPNQQIRSLTPL